MYLYGKKVPFVIFQNFNVFFCVWCCSRRTWESEFYRIATRIICWDEVKRHKLFDSDIKKFYLMFGFLLPHTFYYYNLLIIHVDRHFQWYCNIDCESQFVMIIKQIIFFLCFFAPVHLNVNLFAFLRVVCAYFKFQSKYLIW